MRRIGVLGGSFDPIHNAHLILAEVARTQHSLDSILFIPARQPPHKPGRALAPAQDRLQMVRLAIEGRSAFAALSVELDRDGPSYTLLTVRQLREQFGSDAELFLIVGADSVRDIPNWWHADELVREIDIIAFDRPGHNLDEGLGALAARFGQAWVRKVLALRVAAPLLDISATDIRERVRMGKSIQELVPEPVRAYIAQHGLYAGG